MPRRRVRRRKRPGVRRPSAGERSFEKLAERVKSVKGLRFGKRVAVGGKYFQEVKDQRGRVVSRVPWSQKVKRQVRSAVEVYYGKETRKTLREAGLDIPGWKPVRGAYDPTTKEAIWTKSVWTGPGAPVGTPDLSKRHKSFGYFGAAFDAVHPERFERILDKLPPHLLRPGGASIGLVVTLRSKEGGPKVQHVYFKDKIDGYVLGSPVQFLNSLFADALMDVAHEYGYAGEMDVVGIAIMIGGPAL